MFLSLACSDTAMEQTSNTSNVNESQCTEKCDGLADQINDLYSDMRRLNLDDLVSLGAGLATQELNQQLANLPYLNVELSPILFFGPNLREIFDTVMI
jgi:hypothetical protein